MYGQHGQDYGGGTVGQKTWRGAPSTRPQEPRAPRSRLPEPAPKDRGQAGPEDGFLIPHLAGCSQELALSLSQMQRGKGAGHPGACRSGSFAVPLCRWWWWSVRFLGAIRSGPSDGAAAQPPAPCPASQMGQACLKASIQSSFCHHPPQFLYFLHPRRSSRKQLSLFNLEKLAAETTPKNFFIGKTSEQMVIGLH
jgi:hypothetical protein